MAFGDTATLADDFNRSFENPISTNWTVTIDSADSNAICEANQFRGAVAALCTAWYDVADPADDFDAYGTFVNLVFGRASYVYGRLSDVGSSTPDGYVVKIGGEGDGFHVRLYRIDNGSWTELDDSGSISASNGDYIGLRCNGDSIEGWLYTSGSWSMVVSATDSTYATSGHVGLGTSGTGELNGFDDFYLGDVDEGPVGSRISQVPVEVAVVPTDAQGRISQVPVEVAVVPTDAQARTSQVVVEVLVFSPDAGLGQFPMVT